MRKVSKTFQASKKIVVVGFLGTTLLMSFQNCAPGFKIDSSGEMVLASGSGPVPRAPTGPTQPQQLVSQNAVVVNRNYIVSVLLDIFSQNNGQIRQDVRAEVDKWIFLQTSQFGGGCDVNTSASGQDCGPVIPNYHGGNFLGNTISHNLASIPISLSVSTIRQSYMLKACENIASLNPAMDYVREKIAVANGTEVTDAVISGIYMLFFRDDPPSSQMLSIIRDLNNDLKARNESLDTRWRAAFSFICELPAWQTP